MLSEEFKFTNLYDHYKETIKYLKDDLKKRDKLTLYSLILIIFYFLIEFKSSDSVSLVNKYLEKKIGLELNINYDLLTTAILLLLFRYTLKYFQINLNIEKQYNYIHKLEDDLNNLANSQLITREGFSYLEDYPLLSALIHRLYNFFLPLGLIVVMIIKLIQTFQNFSLLNILIISLIILCTFLYLLFTYKDLRWVNCINCMVKKLFVLIHLYKEDN